MSGLPKYTRRWFGPDELVTRDGQEFRMSDSFWYHWPSCRFVSDAASRAAIREAMNQIEDARDAEHSAVLRCRWGSPQP